MRILRDKRKDPCKDEPELTAQLEGIASRLSVLAEELDSIGSDSKCAGRQAECYEAALSVRQALDPITNLVEKRRVR